MKPRLYVETSVVSYLAARRSSNSDTANRQRITAHWWEQERHRYELLISETVEEECRRGDREQSSRRMKILAEISVVSLNSEIIELAEALIGPRGLPAIARLDALHVAAAGACGCEYLLTWNIRHIANGRTRAFAERTLISHGYKAPVICTPEELFSVG
jgi:predicted nucleic acid-binding protein